MKTLTVDLVKRWSFRWLAAAAMGIALFGVATPARAQAMATMTIDVPFVAASQTLPAGAYSVRIQDGKATLQLTDGKGPSVVMIVVTRLGRHDKDTDAEFVFDKVNKELRLSEIWLPGQDGFLLLATAGEHVHQVIGGSNPHK